MTDDKFFEWYMRFWSAFGTKYTNSKGVPSKGYEAAVKACAKAIKDQRFHKHITTKEEFCKACDLGLEAQKIYTDDAKRCNKFAPSLGMVSSWFNGEKWGKQVGSHAELHELKQAHKPGKKPVYGETKNKEQAKQKLQDVKRLLKGG